MLEPWNLLCPGGTSEGVEEWGGSLETEDIGYNGMPFIRWAEAAEWSNPGDTEEMEAALAKHFECTLNVPGAF